MLHFIYIFCSCFGGSFRPVWWIQGEEEWTPGCLVQWLSSELFQGRLRWIPTNQRNRLHSESNCSIRHIKWYRRRSSLGYCVLRISCSLPMWYDSLLCRQGTCTRHGAKEASNVLSGHYRAKTCDPGISVFNLAEIVGYQNETKGI